MLPDRRAVLRLLALGVAAPAWAADEKRPSLRALRREAEDEGLPLLVLVFPADPRSGAPRGGARASIWGDLLTWGYNGVFDLYLVSCVAATDVELRAAVAPEVELPEDPFVALFEPGRSAPRVLKSEDLPQSVRGPLPAKFVPRELELHEDHAASRRAGDLARCLHEFLHPDGAALARRRADLDRAALLRPTGAVTRARRAVLDAALEAGSTAAWSPETGRVVKALADLVGHPPPITGARLEPVPSMPAGPHGCHGVPCGSAHVPTTGRRFLAFYVDGG